MTIDYVIVGIDDSFSSRAALRWAGAYAEATDTNLCAVHVLDWPIGLAPSSLDRGTRLYVPQRDVAAPYWRGIRQAFDDAQPPQGSTLEFAQGDVGDVLVRLSDHAKLLVVGTREPSPEWSNRHGSIGHYCISYGNCPVVTVPAFLLTELLPQPSCRCRQQTPVSVAG